jgi:hypothetical protein
MKSAPLRLPDPAPMPGSPPLLLASADMPSGIPALAEVEGAKSAREKRAESPLFPLTWSLGALAPVLPLPFPVDPALPPSPKVRYRSAYCPPEPGPLFDEDRRNGMSDFELAVHLIDFSALERPLAQFYVPSARGQTPFHPVSMFLAVALRIESGQSWRKVAALLSGENGAGYRRLFGFAQGDTPSASGLRYFYQSVGPEPFAQLGPAWAQMLRAAGLFPLAATYPGDPPDRGVTMTQDGMLHEALSRPACQLATDQCYQPLEGRAEGQGPPEQAAAPALETAPPTPGASDPLGGRSLRPCRARRNGHEGCLCDTAACQEQCRRASSLDAEARFIHYEGRNKTAGPDSPRHSGKDEHKSSGRNVFGYRSVADRVLDDRWSAAWTVSSDLHPANIDEASLFLAGLAFLALHLPWLKIGEWLDDAAIGFEACLKAIWRLGALRMVDIRADKADGDFEACLRRGYDGRGYPLCAHGYAMAPNGYDRERRRAKWTCNQACRREVRREGEPVSPPSGCPYLDETRPLGQVRNVALTFPDGSTRLAREIPYGSAAWKARYGRRNLSESRNGQLEMMGLKRMRSFGLERARKDIRLADFLLNLRTLGRLVREASDLADN